MDFGYITDKGRAQSAIDFKNRISIWVGIARTIPWPNESDPPKPSTETTTMDELIGLKRVSDTSLVVSDITGTIIEYNVPTISSTPLYIISANGYLWYISFNGNKLGRVTPSNGSIVEFNIPTSSSSPNSLCLGPDGNIWFVETSANKIGRFDISNSTFTEFNIPTSNSDPRNIITGPDGSLWFTELNSNQIGRITTSGVFTEFTGLTPNAGVIDITPGSDGALWFTESSTNKIGRITTGGSIQEFALPLNSQPNRITLGNDGAIWFTEPGTNKIGKMTINGLLANEFTPLTTNSLLRDISVGPDGNIWYVGFNSNKIGRIKSDNSITEYDVPTSVSGSISICPGPDGNMWFVESVSNKVSRLLIDQYFSSPTADVINKNGVLYRKITDSEGLLLGATDLYIMAEIQPDEFTGISYRQTGIFVDSKPAEGYSSFTALTPDKFADLGVLVFISNSLVQTRYPNTRHRIEFVLPR